MKRIILSVLRASALVTVFVGVTWFLFGEDASEPVPVEPTWWEIQSIDTMKFSRDLAREKAEDRLFNAAIDEQVSLIAQTGATHVAIGTPYDDEFIPYMKRWVAAARRQGLQVWFRGNFAGWEGWFEYEPISPEEHLRLLETFILSNGDLFENGDLFSPCTECENGGPGDPRMTGNVRVYRNFLIEEYKIANQSFRRVGKNIRSNFPMNGDVARLIMNRETTQALGGVVVVDHYVEHPDTLVRDLNEIAVMSSGRVILGEFGVPIPDIHGPMSPIDQARWLADTLKLISQSTQLVGINYWVSFGGSTSLWAEDFSPKPAVSIISNYYQPHIINGTVLNELERPIESARIIVGSKQVITESNGSFRIPAVSGDETLHISAEGYQSTLVSINDHKTIIIEKSKPSVFFRIQRFLHRLRTIT